MQTIDANLLTGRDKHYEKVREYKIGYSNDGENFKEYEEDGNVKVGTYLVIAEMVGHLKVSLQGFQNLLKDVKLSPMLEASVGEHLVRGTILIHDFIKWGA